MLTVALPKGRIAKDTLEIFGEIFGDEFKFDDRKLTEEDAVALLDSKVYSCCL